MYFSKRFDDFELPDGSVANSMADVDRYLKRSGAAPAADYSANYYVQKKFNRDDARRRDLFADFINNYKRTIWNGKR